MARVPNVASGGSVARPRFTLKPSKQTCIALGALIGVTLVSGAGLYVMQTNQIAAKKAEVDGKRKQVEDGDRTAKRLTQVEMEYAETANKIRYLESSVSQQTYVPGLLKQMEQTAKSVNMTVDSVRPTFEYAPAPPADKEARKNFKPWPYDKVHIEMQVRGTYWNVAQLLYRLTEFPKILAVDRLQINPPGDVSKGSPQLNVTLAVTGYLFKNDDKPVAATASGGPGLALPRSPGGAPSLPPRASIDEQGQVTGGLKRPSPAVAAPAR